LPASVIAERVGWDGSPSWFREKLARLRPQYRRSDPADRLTWASGDATQCDLRFPPGRIPLEDGSTPLLPVLVITAAHSRFMTGRDQTSGRPRRPRPDQSFVRAQVEHWRDRSSGAGRRRISHAPRAGEGDVACAVSGSDGSVKASARWRQAQFAESPSG
jgi:hypothetical protein